MWYHLAKKDLKIILKDKVSLVVLLLLPIMFITLMSFALKGSFGAKTSLSLVLYADKDNSELSQAFIKHLASIEGIELTKAPSEKNAKAQVDQGKAVLFVTLPTEFSRHIQDQKTSTVRVYGDPAQGTVKDAMTQAITGQARLFTLDYQLKQYATKQGEMSASYVQKELATILNQLPDQLKKEQASQSKTQDQSQVVKESQRLLDQMMGKQVLAIKAEQAGKEELQPDVFQQNVPGYTVMFAFFIVMFAGKTFLREKELGTWLRFKVSDLSVPALYLGKFVPYFIVGMSQVTCLLAFGRFVFGMSLGSSMFALACLTLSLVASSTAFGLLIASLARTESQVTGLSLFIVLATAALGGTMVPLQMMPDMMQAIAKFVPHSWALTGYQNLFVRQQGFASIALNSGILLGLALVMILTAFGILFARRKEAV